MKSTRKLIPAIAMLVLSAVLMSTASFAWFSMNEDVTANGIKISANTDAAYLAISIGNTLLADADSAVEWSKTATSLKPVAIDASAYKNAGTYSSWYTAQSSDPNDAGKVSSSAEGTALQSADDLKNYVLVETVTVGYADGSTTASKDLYATATVTGDDTTNKVTTPIKVLLVAGDTAFLAGSAKTKIGAVGSSDLTISIYVYYDGNDSAVTTNNATKLDSATIDLTFTTVAPTT